MLIGVPLDMHGSDRSLDAAAARLVQRASDLRVRRGGEGCSASGGVRGVQGALSLLEAFPAACGVFSAFAEVFSAEGPRRAGGRAQKLLWAPHRPRILAPEDNRPSREVKGTPALQPANVLSAAPAGNMVSAGPEGARLRAESRRRELGIRRHRETP